MIRLYVTAGLGAGGEASMSPAQAHYLFDVMRLKAGDQLLVFNGRDGEWRARATRPGKPLKLVAKSRAQAPAPDLELVAALVKRPRLETIVEKAAELGVRRVRLATTERTVADRANLARLSAIAAEASEQTGRLDVPEVAAPAPLKRLLAAWPAERALMFCDEAGEAPPALAALAAAKRSSWSVLIGPEGGFSPMERALVRACPQATAVSLGPRVLRADTAAVAALTLWQAALGDLDGP